MVDPRDQKIVVFNWNKKGYDVNGNVEAVLDYEKVWVLPCLIFIEKYFDGTIKSLF